MSCKTHNLFQRINSMKGGEEASSRAGGGAGSGSEAGFHLNQIWRHLFLQGPGSGKPCPIQTVCLALALNEGHKASLSPSVQQREQWDYSIHYRINICKVLRKYPGRMSSYSYRRHTCPCSVISRGISTRQRKPGTCGTCGTWEGAWPA